MSVTVVSQAGDDGTSRRLDNLEQELDETKEQAEHTEAVAEAAQSAAVVSMASPSFTRDEVAAIVDERMAPILGELQEWRQMTEAQLSAMNQSPQPNMTQTSPPENNGEASSHNDLNNINNAVTLEPETVPNPPKPKTRHHRMMFHRK